jgi:hypothetical protein
LVGAATVQASAEVIIHAEIVTQLPECLDERGVKTNVADVPIADDFDLFE